MTQLTTITQSTVNDLLTKMAPEFRKALQGSIPIERFMRVALTEFRDTPKLNGCDAKSFLGALMMCAQLGLEPGKSLGHAYIIPYGNKATFMLGYRGMVELLYRSDKVVSINANEVYENDFFDFAFGLEEKLIHTPCRGERGALTYVYIYVRLTNGGKVMGVMSKEDVDAIRKRSKTGNSGPWVTDYAEMAKKTMIRRMFKLLPSSVQCGPVIQRAIIADEAGDRGEQNDYFDIEIETENQEEELHMKSIVDEVKDLI